LEIQQLFVARQKLHNLIKDLIKTQPLQNLTNAQTKWELLKQEIKEITIDYAKNKENIKKNILTTLEQELVLYNAILNPSEEQIQQIEYLKNKQKWFLSR